MTLLLLLTGRGSVAPTAPTLVGVLACLSPKNTRIANIQE